MITELLERIVKQEAVVVIVCLVGLASCGGGGGGSGTATPPPPPTNASPGGIFNGTAEGCIACPIDIAALISEDGDWIVLDRQFASPLNLGVLSVAGTSFNGTRLLFTQQQMPLAFGHPPTAPALRHTPADSRSFDGDLVERESIEGTFFHNGAGNTTAQLSYDSNYETGSSLIALSGMYSGSDPSGYALTYEISPSGVVSGSDSTGCMVMGTANSPNSAYNLYAFELDFSSCGGSGAVGQYFGFGALVASGAPSGESLLFYGVSDDENTLVVLELPKL